MEHRYTFYLTSSLPTKGASMLPKREKKEDDPTPTLRTAVGNISAAYWYTMAKDAVMANFPS